MFLSMSDLGQSTNMTQASNAYSKGRASASRGDTQIARLSLAELQFTYNNAKNAGNQSEAEEILRLYNFLNAAMNPEAAPIPAAAGPQNFAIDMSVTKTSGNMAPSAVAAAGGRPSAPASGPNYLLWGGIAVGVTALVGGAYFFMNKGGSKS